MNLSEIDPGKFRMEGTWQRILGVYSGPFTIGMVLGYIFVRMLPMTRQYWLVFLLIPLFGYVFADLVLWLWRGVRLVELDDMVVGIVVARAQNREAAVELLDHCRAPARVHHAVERAHHPVPREALAEPRDIAFIDRETVPRHEFTDRDTCLEARDALLERRRGALGPVVHGSAPAGGRG